MAVASSVPDPDEQAPDTTSRTRVIARFRPLTTQEARQRCICYLAADSVQYVDQDASSNSGSGAANLFSFDQVLDEQTSQQEVFSCVAPIVQSVLQGYNGTILAYGQTGSGKTHTLLGDISNPVDKGIVPRAVSELARGIAATKAACSFSVTLSVVEIYCEKIRDLLDTDNDNLAVVTDRARGIIVSRATELPVQNEQELVQHMQRGISNRTIAATAMNAGSSRSHCIVYLMVEKVYEEDGRVEHGKLCLVDLAGSERQDKTGAEGQTFDEGKQINKSLSALGNVVNTLTDGRKGAYIPYRDSKLTRVLQDSLGGTAKTALIICCSPSQDNGFETLSSLRFGTRAKGIAHTLQVNAPKRSVAEELTRALAASKAECTQLRGLISLLQMHVPPEALCFALYIILDTNT
ncbi:hypothetical protein WJX72_003710 [[Myrmecia] bisecta]|uniref:Kinesin-like protein n=1 Tax=[Myrmecia] bisecta TaxID=41462 RepID=A0AAW1P6H0_9CHLO